jgi:hypothetical protein
MLGVCERCQQRIATEACVVELQHGEVVRLTDGLPRLKVVGVPEQHALCRPCGRDVASAVQALMTGSQASAT